MKMIFCVYHALVQHRSKQIYNMEFRIHFTSSEKREKNRSPVPEKHKILGKFSKKKVNEKNNIHESNKIIR